MNSSFSTALPGNVASTRRPLLSTVALVGFLLLTFLAATPASWIDSRGFYSTIARPDWAPPGWLFGPVWTALYVTIGVAAWGVWRKAGWNGALWLWLGQLVLNFAWTPIFFQFRSPGWALVEIIALWLAIIATMVAFHRHARWAAWLLAPYLAWVSFATALTFTIWRLNS